MKLLFITQKIHEKDDDLAFTILWIKEFIKQGVEVEAICLEKGDFDGSFPVYSLGKEAGVGKIGRIFRFLKYILTLKYDRVFIHMNTEYVTLGGWYWFLTRKEIYLWYTHYTMHFHLWLTGLLSKRMFAATKQSLPQYEGNQKKVITGHGIDVAYWEDIERKNYKPNKYDLLAVHRICRSKRLELVIMALKYLPLEYNLSIYGRDVEKDYHQGLLEIVKKEGLEKRVNFMGAVPMEELKLVYQKYGMMVNMASETIDKTMLEGMMFGLYPVTTPGNSKAIGLPIWPEGEKSEDLAKFILEGVEKYPEKYLKDIVKENHSLEALIRKMNKYIKNGE